jgi:hypothetical protein
MGSCDSKRAHEDALGNTWSNNYRNKLRFLYGGPGDCAGGGGNGRGT